MLGNRTSSTIKAPITANLIMSTHVTLDHTLLVPVCSGQHVPPKYQAVESANVSVDVGYGAFNVRPSQVVQTSRQTSHFPLNIMVHLEGVYANGIT